MTEKIEKIRSRKKKRMEAFLLVTYFINKVKISPNALLIEEIRPFSKVDNAWEFFRLV